jgi:hypothetical protein
VKWLKMRLTCELWYQLSFWSSIFYLKKTMHREKKIGPYFCWFQLCINNLTCGKKKDKFWGIYNNKNKKKQIFWWTRYTAGSWYCCSPLFCDELRRGAFCFKATTVNFVMLLWVWRKYKFNFVLEFLASLVLTHLHCKATIVKISPCWHARAVCNNGIMHKFEFSQSAWLWFISQRARVKGQGALTKINEIL